MEAACFAQTSVDVDKATRRHVYYKAGFFVLTLRKTQVRVLSLFDNSFSTLMGHVLRRTVEDTLLKYLALM